MNDSASQWRAKNGVQSVKMCWSVRKKTLSMNEIKTSYLGKCLNDKFIHLLQCMKKLTCLLCSLLSFFDASQLYLHINKLSHTKTTNY